MKKILLFLCVCLLAACDKPQENKQEVLADQEQADINPKEYPREEKSQTTVEYTITEEELFMTNKSEILEVDDYEEKNLPAQPEPAAPRNLSLKDQLFEAVRDADKSKVTELIAQKANVNELKQKRRWVSCGPDCDGYTIMEYSPLHAALETQKVYQEQIANYQKNLKNPDEYALTQEEILPLLQEAKQKEKDMADIVRLLKENGAKDICEEGFPMPD